MKLSKNDRQIAILSLVAVVVVIVAIGAAVVVAVGHVEFAAY